MVSADEKKIEPPYEKNKLQVKLIMILHGCYIDCVVNNEGWCGMIVPLIP